MSEEKKEEGVLNTLFGYAESLLGGVEKAIVPKTGEWVMEEMIEDGHTIYEIKCASHKVTCDDEKIAKRICDVLND